MNSQQAINLLKGLEQSLDDYCGLNDEGKAAFRMAITALELFGNAEQLPSAQPDVPDTNVGDMISREAAIDAISCDITVTGRQNAELVAATIGAFADRIKALPSAQPERRCVNCGRTVNNGGWYEDGRTRCPIEEHYALPKDGYCHLWEKRNVTDDDYPERRTDE